MEAVNKLAERIVSILIKLNQNEKLNIDDLAIEFGVSKRTIQRDINERLALLPIEKHNGQISLHQTALGKYNLSDIRRFAEQMGIAESIPYFDTRTIEQLLQPSEHSFHVSAETFESQNAVKPWFNKLQKSISECFLVNFQYKNKEYKDVAPYRLVSQRGSWYLAAYDQTKLKSYALSKIESLVVTFKSFVPDPTIQEQISEEEGIYFGKPKQQVEIRVSSKVAHFFTRKTLLPNQKTMKENDDGSLIILSEVADPLQIIPIVKYWMPHLSVISPQGISKQITEDVKEYLEIAATV